MENVWPFMAKLSCRLHAEITLIYFESALQHFMEPFKIRADVKQYVVTSNE